jgi:hypothetical protein
MDVGGDDKDERRNWINYLSTHSFTEEHLTVFE